MIFLQLMYDPVFNIIPEAALLNTQACYPHKIQM